MGAAASVWTVVTERRPLFTAAFLRSVLRVLFRQDHADQLSMGIENVTLREPPRRGSVATGAGRFPGSRRAHMSRLPGLGHSGVIRDPNGWIAFLPIPGMPTTDSAKPIADSKRWRSPWRSGGP